MLFVPVLVVILLNTTIHNLFCKFNLRRLVFHESGKVEKC